MDEVPFSLKLTILVVSNYFLLYLCKKIYDAYLIDKFYGPQMEGDDVMELSFFENPFGGEVYCLQSKAQREADELSEILMNETPFEQGYRAYWDGLEVYEVSKAQVDGWWYARSEIEFGYTPNEVLSVR